VDVGVGTFFSNVVVLFTLLKTAITLKRHGTNTSRQSRQAAEAFWPPASSRPTLFNFGATGVGPDFAGINPVKAHYWAVDIGGGCPLFFSSESYSSSRTRN
jgi:hypothetical protein